METPVNSVSVDVLIVGSGPVGAAYARVLADSVPGITIMMVDLGPQLTSRAGRHVKNIVDNEERAMAQIESQGPNRFAYPIPSIQERAEAASTGHVDAKLLARPGTHLVTDDDDELLKSGMPAASFSSNVGGMGSHWTCACPRPGNSERIPFIDDEEWDVLCNSAEKLLAVSQTTFDETPEAYAIKKVLGDLFNPVLPPFKKVQRMPLACGKDDNGEKYWTGPDVILGDLLEKGTVEGFELRPETLCREIINSEGKVTGAVIEHLPSGRTEKINSKITIVAADAIRTPQLLWASGIRPDALGHYLNDQPQLMCAVTLDDDLVKKAAGDYEHLHPANKLQNVNDSTVGVFWVPFHDPDHPFHGQVMHMDMSPIQVEASGQSAKNGHVVGLGWFCRKELRYEDYLEFDTNEKDYLGLPKITIHYQLTGNDRKEIAAAMKEQAKAAVAFGKVLRTGEQFMIPAGSSLHYQGTVRMGTENDGRSVCNSHSEVWGYKNLFVGGNGVIPTATACNPTLTSVALAVRACGQIVNHLKKGK